MLETPTPIEVEQRRQARINREQNAEAWAIACRIVSFSEAGMAYAGEER